MEVKGYENGSFESEQDYEMASISKTSSSEETFDEESSNESYDLNVIMNEVGDLKTYHFILVLMVTWITIPDG